MKIRFALDRVSAFKSGINTQDATCSLEIDPVTLSDADRALLGARLNQRGDVCGRNKDGKYYDGYYSWDGPCSPYKYHSGERSVRIVMAAAPSLDALLAGIRSEEQAIQDASAAKASEEAQKKADVRAATLKVLQERKTSSKREYLDGHSYDWMGADWPYLNDSEVRQSPEAVAWEAEIAVVREAAKQQCQQRIDALKAAEKAKKDREEIAKRQVEEQRDTWIKAHGSSRLQRMLQEGIERDASYRDERLAKELPGWRWVDKVAGDCDDPRNPPEEAFALLDEAREVLADAELQYWTVPHEEGEDDYFGEDDAPEYDWTGYVALAPCPWYPRNVVYGGPK